MKISNKARAFFVLHSCVFCCCKGSISYAELQNSSLFKRQNKIYGKSNEILMFAIQNLLCTFVFVSYPSPWEPGRYKMKRCEVRKPNVLSNKSIIGNSVVVLRARLE